MSSPTLGLSRLETNRFDRVQCELEAGLVFAAAAIEYQMSNPRRSETCRTEAEDCYATALDLIRQGGFTQDHIGDLRSVLSELEQQLSLLRSAGGSRQAAA